MSCGVRFCAGWLMSCSMPPSPPVNSAITPLRWVVTLYAALATG